MKQIIAQLISYNYDVFVPTELGSLELIISCPFFTKRCYYRPAVRDNDGLFVSLDKIEINDKSLVIDCILSYNELRQFIYMIPLDECIMKRRKRINTDKYRLLPISSTYDYTDITEDVDNIVEKSKVIADAAVVKKDDDKIDEIDIMAEGRKESEFYSRLLRGSVEY